MNFSIMLPIVGGFYIFYHSISYLFTSQDEENLMDYNDLHDYRSEDEVFRKSYNYSKGILL